MRVVVGGRVLAVESGERAVVLIDGTQRVIVGAVGGVIPGDLVRVHVVDDSGGVLRATAIERVFRPDVPALDPGTEAGVFALAGGHARLQARDRVRCAVRAHFVAHRSLEVDTPTIAVSPGLDVHLHAFDVGDTVASAVASRTGYLITSPEYHMKRLLVGGVARCFQFARCFRAREIGSRHEPEFTMLEWYRAWDGAAEMMAETIAVVAAAARAAGAEGAGAAIRVGERTVRLHDGFDVITVREAFARWAPSAGDPIALAAHDEPGYFAALSERIEPALGAERPAFLTRFPAQHASLAALCGDDASVCERFELYVGGIELSNGFVELTDPSEQRSRFERDRADRAVRGLPVYPIDEGFLSALAQGMPPSVGNALGFDRLVALVTGRSAIADVIAFPAARR